MCVQKKKNPQNPTTTYHPIRITATQLMFPLLFVEELVRQFRLFPSEKRGRSMFPQRVHICELNS